MDGRRDGGKKGLEWGRGGGGDSYRKSLYMDIQFINLFLAKL